MKSLSNLIKEHKYQPIDDQWINDEKPVMTADGREVKILSVDLKQVPNVIIGQITSDGHVYNFQWEDTGKCIHAEAKLGNPVKPTDDDKLVKAI